MTPKRLVVHEGGTAKMPGFQHPNAKVLAATPESIAIKIPAHSFATGPRGLGRSYAPAETLVFRIVQSHGIGGIAFSGHGEILDVELVIRWTHEKPKKA